MPNAKPVYLGLGSNVDARRNLASGLDALKRRFGQVLCSPLYQSKAVGFDGSDFLNACCLVHTELDPEALKAWLTALEDRHGRQRDLPKFADRTLDIDILLHGDHAGRFGKLELPRRNFEVRPRPQTAGRPRARAPAPAIRQDLRRALARIQRRPNARKNYMVKPGPTKTRRPNQPTARVAHNLTAAFESQSISALATRAACR
ncbi:MAG: 2-amino-4-hydroxy-6-hydroxymethyldihydropteridine diphosphokinase [Wenzhouxiangellaceae bacterium]